MKKFVVVLLALAMLVFASAAMADNIKVGIVNNPPSESGYRAANVADFERVFLLKTAMMSIPPTA